MSINKMSINKRLLLSSMFNVTWSKYMNEKVLITTTNNSDNRILSDKMLSSNSWILNRFTIIQRAAFILSLVVLFWIIFVVIYMSSRLIVQLIPKLKRFHYDSPSTSHDKICRTFVISSNQYGSFRPTCLPSPLLYRSDSLFSNSDFTLNNEQMTAITDYGSISRRSTDTIPNQEEKEQSNANNTSLLEHYLNTYNPLQIDLTNTNEGTAKRSIVKDGFYEEAPSDTDTHPMTNCYPFNCTNKRKLHHGERYTRLKEQENCSATMSVADDRLSECSTKLTSIVLPVVMITDCSDSQRLHTDIIELNEEEKDK